MRIVSAEIHNRAMNWTDLVDLGSEVLPRAVLRVVVIVFVVLMIMNGPAATRLVLSYGEAKARPLIDSILKETSPEPTAPNLTSPHPPK